MIRLLVKLGHWLEARFPEKVIVLEQDYQDLKERIRILEAFVNRTSPQIEKIATLESSAVHKGAVQDVIKIVATMRNELSSLKTSLGFSAGTEAAKIEAYLSGEPVNTGDNNDQ